MNTQEKEPKKIIRTFAVASFLNDLGSDVIYPIWPLFVTTILKANMAALGLLDGLGEALVSLSQAASGYISDRIKKQKVFIWTGYLFGVFFQMGLLYLFRLDPSYPFQNHGPDGKNERRASRRAGRRYFDR